MGAVTRAVDTVCPFCALLCDDLVIEAEGTALRVVAHGCPRARPRFAMAVPGDAVPLVAGRPATLAAAVARAAAILGAARAPRVAGLGTDTAGLRAAFRLAERLGATIGHAHGAGLSANLAALQSTGWVTATLAEARNRPDLVLLVGSDGAEAAPRLHERVLRPPRTLDADGPPARRVVQLGGDAPADAAIEHLACTPEQLLGTVGSLRALVAGRPVPAASGLVELAQALSRARYALIVWAVGSLPDALPIVAHLAALTQSLNAQGRAAGLPLAGPDNVIGANQMAAWQTGVPLPLTLAAGIPEHDPVGPGESAPVAREAADALLWISTFADLEPPGGDAPAIVLARPGFVPGREAEVLIPTGVPGLDHEGSLYRTDGVVALPVRRLRDTGLPSAALVVDGIAAALPPGGRG